MSVRLEILVSTLGAAGIERLARQQWPGAEGVRRIVVWQQAEGQVPAELRRPDTCIIISPTRGLTASRNHALAEASAPWALLSDDDVSFTDRQLANLRDALELETEADIALIHANVEGSRKVYPNERRPLPPLPRGYWLSSIEMAIRIKAWRKAGMKFRPEFGLGSGVFESGEEDVAFADAMKRGLRAIFLPVEAGRHTGASTGMQTERPSFWFAKGGVLRYLHGKAWWLRLARIPVGRWIHVVRGARRGSRIRRTEEF